MRAPDTEPPDAPNAPRRLGFMKGDYLVPDDFDRMAEAEIVALFEGECDQHPPA
jgi:hypothetical protein